METWQYVLVGLFVFWALGAFLAYGLIKGYMYHKITNFFPYALPDYVGIVEVYAREIALSGPIALVAWAYCLWKYPDVQLAWRLRTPAWAIKKTPKSPLTPGSTQGARAPKPPPDTPRPAPPKSHKLHEKRPRLLKQAGDFDWPSFHAA